MRYLITDAIREVFGPMVERCASRLGPDPGLPDRMFFEAVLYRARTGIGWRDPPASSAPGTPSTTASAAGSTPAAWSASST